jgi:Ricin-type beta-trefoil lectin domain
MTNRLRLIPIVLAMLAFVPVSATAQSIPDGQYYKLSTEFRGLTMKLDVFNGGPKNNMTRLEPDQNVTGQFWRIKRINGGWYQLSTQFRGSNMCLDIFNGGSTNNEPHLAPCDNLTGQHWKISGDNHMFRLTTEFRGPDMCLDIFNGGANNNQPQLRQCGNFTGQAWTLTRTDTSVEGVAVESRPGHAPASGCKPNEVFSSSMGQCIPKM